MPSAELVSMVAASATTEEELKAYVRKLSAYTGETEPEKLLHILAASMPNWDVAIPATAKQPAAIEAMHKIISLTPTTSESAKRFRELTRSSIPPANVKTRNELLDIMPLLFEGIRRHDELRQLVLFVPDDLSLKSSATKPTPDPEETDPAIVRDVWVRASSGARLADWERQVAVDAYRIRRLVARWLDEGALQPA